MPPLPDPRDLQGLRCLPGLPTSGVCQESQRWTETRRVDCHAQAKIRRKANTLAIRRQVCPRGHIGTCNGTIISAVWVSTLQVPSLRPVGLLPLL